MSEEKSSSIGTMIVVAIAAGLIGYVIGKPASPQAQDNATDASEKPTQPEKPTEPKEPAFVKEGLVAYSPFNGNAKDESGNGNDSTSKGATLTEDRHGNADSAYAFDGSAYMETPNDATLQQKAELSISIWVNPSRAEKHTALIFKDEHPGENFGVWLRAKGNEIDFSIYKGDSKEDGAGLLVAKPSLVPLGVYSMITVTFANRQAKAYVNGELIGTKAFNTSPGIDNQPLLLGYSGDNRYDKFKGEMDDVRIYNRALSEEQVKALHDSEKPKE